MNKTELIRWLEEEEQKWELILAAIGEQRMEQAGVNGEWSMRDIVAHLTGWQRWLVARLQASAAGQAAPPPPWSANLTSEDAINTWIYESNRQRPARLVLEEMRAVHEQLLATLQTMPEDARIESIEAKFHVIWAGEQRFAVGEFFHHFYDDHAANVRTWLEKTA
ncbi:MAG: ClbS/DfsB family four-helix bundle protein [Caldilineaceae bacterium]